MGKVIGIDLGTTNSCVAVFDNGETRIIANAEGGRTTPSIIAFSASGEKLVGQIAKRQAITNPANTIYAVKRLIGRKFDSAEVKQFASISPFRIEPAENGDARVRVGDRTYSAQEISAMVLAKMRETASDFLGEVVTDAVITVPAYFDDSQRQATQDAGRIAGLNVLRIINEPTAAALSFGLDKHESGRIAVFDLGGGTFDISIMEIADSVFEVRSTNGDTYLGGEDWDIRLTDYLIDAFKDEHGIDLRADPMALQRIKEAAERAKHELSSCEETEISLPFVAADDSGPKHLNHAITRAKLEELTHDLLDRLDEPCRIALEDAGLRREEIDEVVLVGGMTRMPAVQAKVEAVFGKTAHKGVDPDEVVAAGAAIQGGVLSGTVDQVLLLDVTPLSLGVETQGGVATPIIPRNTTVPTSNSQVFSTTEDNQTVVRIHVVQGEREMAADNKTLGRFELVGLPPAPRGVPQIEVTFDIDADGVVNVSARDLGTGKSQAIRVTASSGLSEKEIQGLVHEAEQHSQTDKQRRELVELRNEADGLIYSTERTLTEFAENVSDEDRGALQKAIADTRAAMEGEETAALRAAIDALASLTYKMTESLYAELGGAAD
ncbi:MAG: molecular chaperone DnaK [Myxococcales bacterium]|nr:molecular chaperone DnaK [Myxococcales bacterium]MDH5306567.1 molecular chaperone DnaK [Myxococcales bacterium]MDH5567302.1 molecular chaperone DnaK [Myxococcales bacterium]